MKVADLLEQRRKNWQELEQLCDQLAPHLNPWTIVSLRPLRAALRSLF